jgi:hypothetical protein
LAWIASLGGGADDGPPRVSFDEAEEGRYDLNFINETEVETVVRVDLDHFDSSGAVGRQSLEHGTKDLTRAAP